MKQDSDIVRQLDDSDDTLQRGRLRTMQMVALGLLVLAALLFALARSRHGQHPAWGYLEAFAEAAMVGAIADWFAVTALFRHPLGIPLWHTAIIPSSKERIGKNLGNFVENHFITEAAIAQRILDADPARMLGRYLASPEHAARLGALVVPALEQLVRKLDHERIGALLRDAATRELGRLDLSALAGRCVDAMIADEQPRRLVDAVLERLALYLGDSVNHDDVERFILSVISPDNGVTKLAIGMAMSKMISSTHAKVLALRLDRDHPVRQRLDAWIADSALRLKADPAWQAAIDRYQRETLAGEQVQAALGGLWDSLRARLVDDLRGERSGVALGATALLGHAGQLLQNDAAIRDGLNRLLLQGSAHLVRNYRGAVGGFIEAQLARWSAEQMTTRMELALGRDLQFIRINGTLVGGLVGVLIHVVVSSL